MTQKKCFLHGQPKTDCQKCTILEDSPFFDIDGIVIDLVDRIDSEIKGQGARTAIPSPWQAITTVHESLARLSFQRGRVRGAKDKR